MKQEDLLNFFDKVTADMRATMLKKNSDYCGGGSDPFANFTAVETVDFGVSTEQGLMVRMTDKIKRIASFVKQGTLQVKDESVTDTLLDLANYCILFAAYLESKKKRTGVECINGRDDHEMENHKCVYCEMIDKGALAKEIEEVRLKLQQDNERQHLELTLEQKSGAGPLPRSLPEDNVLAGKT